MKIAIEEWELYNNGILLCKWFDTEIDTIEEIEKYVSKVKSSNGLNDDLEMFIVDIEDDITGLIQNDGSVSYAYEISEALQGLEEYELTAISLLLNNGIATDLDNAIELKDDIHSTGENTMEDIAYKYIEDTRALDSIGNLSSYFDYESLGRDMEIEGNYLKDKEGIIWEFIN